jgi:hypothetical protein
MPKNESECTGVRFLNFQKNTFDSDCDEFRLETQSRKFLQRSNLNEIIDMCHGLDRIICLLCVYICHLNIDSISFLLFGHLFFFLPHCKCSNNKKEIYNDKYKHTRDRIIRSTCRNNTNMGMACAPSWPLTS